MGIDYDEPNLDERINSDLVITLKQLLMFAVQISYGLVSVIINNHFYHLSSRKHHYQYHERISSIVISFEV